MKESRFLGNKKSRLFFVVLLVILLVVGTAVAAASGTEGEATLGTSELVVQPFAVSTINVKYLDFRGVTAEEPTTIITDATGAYTFTPPTLDGYTFHKLVVGGSEAVLNGGSYTGNASGGTDIEVIYKITPETGYSSGTWMWFDSKQTANDAPGYGPDRWLRYFYKVDEEVMKGVFAPVNSEIQAERLRVVKFWVPTDQGQSIKNVKFVDKVGDDNGRTTIWYSTDPACKEYTKTKPADESTITSIEFRIFASGGQYKYNNNLNLGADYWVEFEVVFDENSLPAGVEAGTASITPSDASWSSGTSLNYSAGINKPGQENEEVKRTHANNRWQIYFTQPVLKGEVRYQDTGDMTTADYTTASPAAGATVRLLNSVFAQIDIVTTGADGKYEFAEVNTFDKLYIAVEKTGYASYIIPVTQSGPGAIKPLTEEPLSKIASIDKYYWDTAGYTNAGVAQNKVKWNTSADYTPAEIDEILTAQNGRVLLIKNELPTFTVTYDANGGTPDQSVSGIKAGELLTPPINPPTRVGHNFVDWYRDAAATVAWDFAVDTMPPNDLTLFAGWEKTSYTVEFNPQGGTPTPATQTVAFGNMVATPIAPTLARNTLLGWSLDATSTGANLWNFATDTMPANNITLYAVWEGLPKYTVTFDTTGGNPVPGTQSLYEHDFVAKPATDPTLSRMVFKGWYKEVAGTNSWNFATDKMPANNIILYAKWEAEPRYTVTFITDGGAPVPGVQTLYKDDLVAKPATDPTLSRMVFKGWYKEAAGTNPWNFATDKMPAANIKIYAKWEAEPQYVVNFDTQDGTPTPGTQTLYKDELVVKPAQTITKPRAVFKGWYKEATGATPWNFATDKMPASNITIYAQWEAEPTYTVTFNTYGGNPVPGVQTLYAGESVTKPVPNPTKATEPTVAEYEFVGWYKEEEGTNAWNFATDKMPANHIVLHAKWKVTPFYKVTFNPMEGTPAPAPQYLKEGAKVTEPTRMTKSGPPSTYTWKEGNIEWKFATNTMPARNVTLKAIWIRGNWPKTSAASTGGGTSVGARVNTTVADASPSLTAAASVASAVSSKTASVLTAEVATKELTSAISSSQGTATGVSIKLNNYESVNRSLLETLASQAEKGGKTLSVNFDKIVGKIVQSRITLNPALIKKDINLGVETKLDKENLMISLKQKDSFGAPVSIAILVPEALRAQKLTVYSYDPATKAKTELKNANIWMDSKGYIHFNTTQSGNFIVSK